MKSMNRVSGMFGPGKQGAIMAVAIVNLAVFFITSIISILSDGKLHTISSANLIIGIACLSISRNIKNKSI
ncbi:MAG: hypothetical protein ACRDA3_07595 [Peptostreptococcaceae bacterium]